MSTNWLLWIILSRVTGSPVGSAVALLIFWVVADRFTFGVLPDPLRFIGRWRRRAWLRGQLSRNPHDGRARLELAQLELERNKPAAAVEVLRPVFDRGEDDVGAVFTMGAACLGAGYTAQGDRLLDHAEELDPDFRVGEIHLVRGADRLNRKDYLGAKTELEKLVKQRAGTVRGRVLLARALEGLGDDATAALLKDEAWREFVSAPTFQRRRERLWAWRAKPLRPVLYLVVAAVLMSLFLSIVAPRVNEWSAGLRDEDSEYDE